MKAKKNLLMMTLVPTLAVVACTSTITSIALTMAPKVSNKTNDNKPVMFNNQTYDNKATALAETLRSITPTQFDSINTKLWAANVNGANHIFDNPTELMDFVDKQISVIPTKLTFDINSAQANNIIHPLPATREIPHSELQILNINSSTNQPFDLNNVNVYQGNKDKTIYSKSNNDVNAELEAKYSYLDIHKVYYFNGIYFNTLSDLKLYLNNIFAHTKSEPVNSVKMYRKLESPNTKSASEPIQFFADEANTTTNLDDNTIYKVNSFMKTNANQFLKLNNDKYLKLVDNQVQSNAIASIDIADLPIISFGQTEGKSLFVVDANKEEQYGFYGPYFLAAPADKVTPITNRSLWKATEDSPTEVLKSSALDVLASFFDLLLLDPSTNWETKQFGLTYENNDGTLKPENMLIPFLSTDDALRQKEEEMYKILNDPNKIDVNGDTIYTSFIKNMNALIKTKSFSSFYLIPLAYANLMDSIVSWQAPIEFADVVIEFFEMLSKDLDGLFQQVFGDYLLSDYKFLNKIDDPANQKFSFKTFFHIGEKDVNFSWLPAKLDGGEFARKYKPLFVACSVFTQAILNAQNDAKISLDFSFEPGSGLVKDKTLRTALDIVADGTDESQNTVQKINNVFKTTLKSVTQPDGTIKKISIYSMLEAMFNNVSNWTSEVTNSFINNTDSINAKLSNGQDAIGSDGEKELNMDLVNKQLKQIKEFQMNELLLDKDFVDPDEFSSSNPIIPRKLIDKTVKNLNKRKQKALNKAMKDMESFKQDKNNMKGMMSAFEGCDQKDIDKLHDTMTNGKWIDEECGKQVVAMNSLKQQKRAKTYDSVNKVMGVISGAAGTVGDIAQTIMNCLGELKNPVFDDHARTLLIANAALSAVTSLSDFVGAYVPPPFDLICKGLSIICSLITEFIGKPEQKIYEYVVQQPDGTQVKYYWDGGLVTKKLWGLVTEENRGIKDLKMDALIQITSSYDKDGYYFNGNIVGTDQENKIKSIAIKYLNEHPNLKSTSVSKVYSLESDPDKINNTNSYSELYYHKSDASDNQITSLSESIIDDVIKNNHNPWIQPVEQNGFFNGYEIKGTIDDFISIEIQQIVDRIQPIYIAKIPDLDANKYPLLQQSEFQLPKPYFDPSSSSPDMIVRADSELANQNYITYDTNIQNPTEGSSWDKVESKMKKMFVDTFNVHSKTVLYEPRNVKQNFSKIDCNIYDQNIYYTELIPGEIKYFLTKQEASDWIMRQISGTNDNFVLSPNMINALALKYNNETIYFNNYSEFQKWFDSNVKVIGG